MRRRNKREYRFVSVVCFVLAIVFMTSSLLKSINIHSFSMEVEEYIGLYLSAFMQGYGRACAIMVCVMEMTVGLLALKTRYHLVANAMFATMMTFFVYLTGVNYLYPTIFGSIESCGCFGELIHFSPQASFIKSVVLWILSVGLLGYGLHEKRHWNLKMLVCDPYLYICIVVSLVLPLYSYFLFEEMEHTPYIVVYVALCLVIATIVCVSLRSMKMKNV